jgi:hypothetical protein
MSKNILEAALTANTEEIKSEKSPKAKRILMGVDAHLGGINRLARWITE